MPSAAARRPRLRPHKGDVRTLDFILGHPLSRPRPFASLARWASWQVRSRLTRELTVDWIAGLKLAAKNGMTGVTGNIYVGLHEFWEMAFVLHFLREGDVFFDIGANVGSYTLLASGVRGARTEAFEPDPETARWLKRNIEINDLGARVQVHEAALGARTGETTFTVGLDTVNKVQEGPAAGATRTVALRRLDEFARPDGPTLMKIDVEGYELEVLRGGGAVLRAESLAALLIETVTEEAREALTDAGFRPAGYDPKARTLTAAPTVRQANTLFVRDRARVEERVRSAPPVDVWGAPV